MTKSEFEQLSGLKKGKKIGTGAYGRVYEIVNKPKLVVKEQKLISFKREYPFFILLSRKKISPKLHDVFQGKKLGYMIMEKYNGTLRNLADGKLGKIKGIMPDGRLNPSSLKSLKSVVRKLHQSGILHMNLHRDNIMFKKTPTGLKFKIIDPGFAIKVNKPMKGYKSVMNTINRIYHNYDKHNVMRRELQYY